MRTKNRRADMGTWFLLMVLLISSTESLEKIVCEKPSPPENGAVYLTDNSQEVGSQIEYICDEHHIMEPIDSQFAICTVHGHWSSPQPRCIKVCNVPALSNGSIYDIFGRKIKENSYVLDNTELSIICYNGYEKYACDYEPRGLLKCVDGVLHPGSPECRPQRCDIITTIDNGHFRNRGKIVVPGEKIISGSIITFICSEGYELYNKTNPMYLDLEQTDIKCYQGSFSPETPSCVPKRCHVDRLLFLLPEVHYVEHGQTLNVHCPDNMELHLEGNYQKLEVTSVFCSKGIWSPTLPMCIKKMCQTIEVARDITGFIVSKTKTTQGEFVPHNQSIEIVCGEGYRPHGIITCNAGIWMGNSTCEPDVTGCVLKDPGMHFISLRDRTVLTVGENANVSCKFGYEIVANISAKSSNEYYYPDSESTADPSEMSETEDNKNLIAVSDGNYTCIDNGKWEPELRFSCKPISCPPPNQILNGRLIQEAYNGLLNIYESTIRYDCDMGYRIVGPRFRKCQYDRTWSGNDTKCEDIVCEIPSPPENGTVYLTDNSQKVGSQIEYICDEHHIMEPISSKFAICTVHGHWSSPQPRCIKTCKVRTLSNGSIYDNFGRKMTEKSYVLDKTELTFTCYKGYEKYAGGYEPREILKCVDYALHPGSPECRPQRCFIEPTTNLEYFIGQEKELENYIDSGTEMNARCSNRTELFNSSSYLEREQVDVKCNLGKLEPESPVCKDKRCNIIATINNGHFINSGKVVVKGEKILSGSNIKLICFEGYKLYNKTNSMYLDLEQTDIQCYQGSFTSETSSCEPKRCFIEPTTNLEYFIGHKKVLENYIDSGIVMNARCSNRTELFVSSSYLEREQVYVRCNLGKLEPESPVCKDTKCEPLTDTYKVVKTGVVPGILSDKTVVELSCNGSLAKVQAECRNSHWHPKKPKCK